jgi:hypothetical protein
MIADIASVFHWSLADLEALPLDRLIAWREKAIDRWNTMYGGKDG